MSCSNDERYIEIHTNIEQISPLSNRFLVAHSSPVSESTTTDGIPPRAQDESFQSSSSNSKSSSSTNSRSSRLQFLMIQHQSAVNSPLMYSRCTSLGSLSSYDIRSSCNDSYTSECSSVKPSGLISPSDMPDSPPCEPEIIEEEHSYTKLNNNRTLTSSQNRTTMFGETVIDKTLISPKKLEFISNEHNNDDNEHLDEIIIFASDTAEINKYSTDINENLIDDDTRRVFNSQIDENDSINEDYLPNESLSDISLPENLSIIREESSFIEEMNSNDENNSIKILYDFINKPHWTNKTSQPLNKSISSSPSSLSLDDNHKNPTDDEDEYDPEKGRELIQRLIEETLARRSLPTDFLRSTSCVICPVNTPLRSTSPLSSSSISTSTKSCTYITNTSTNSIQHPQRSQSSPARHSSNLINDSKRQTIKQKENIVQQTRSSFLRLRLAQQHKRLYQQDKRI